MTLSEFVNKYNEKTVGSGQCVALIKQYQLEVLETSAPAVGNAKDYWENFESSDFLVATYDKIPVGNELHVGDVVVWNGNVGHGYGHIAIAYDGISSGGFVSFDQNWNTHLSCNIENHSFNNVYGYLRPKSSPEPGPGPGPTPPEPSGPTPVGPVYHREFEKRWFWSTAPDYTGELDFEYMKKENSKYIYNFLKKNKWNNRPIAVVIASMDLISTLNPAWRPNLDSVSEFGLLGFIYSELKDWVDEGGEFVASTDYTIIDNSVGRLCWLVKNNLSWNNENITFEEFSKSQESIQNLVQIFVDSYENNNLEYDELLKKSKTWFNYLFSNNNWKWLYI